MGISAQPSSQELPVSTSITTFVAWKTEWSTGRPSRHERYWESNTNFHQRIIELFKHYMIWTLKTIKLSVISWNKEHKKHMLYSQGFTSYNNIPVKVGLPSLRCLMRINGLAMLLHTRSLIAALSASTQSPRKWMITESLRSMHETQQHQYINSISRPLKHINYNKVQGRIITLEDP